MKKERLSLIIFGVIIIIGITLIIYLNLINDKDYNNFHKCTLDQECITMKCGLSSFTLIESINRNYIEQYKLRITNCKNAMEITNLYNGSCIRSECTINWSIAPYINKSTEEINKFKEDLLQIKKGDSYEKVINLLGNPTYDDVVASKEEPPKWIYRELTYYLVKPNPNVVNEKDDSSAVILLDKENNIVTEIRTDNL